MFGFLNVYKPVGKTSHDVVAILRRVTKVKQIGHTGTLDPFAEGVLPICIGKSTRLIEYLSDDKAYVGTVQFGKSTTTYDIEGEVVNFSDRIPEKEEIEAALDAFRGEIEQFPPKYSAIKLNGKKLYDYPRAGVEVEIKSRRVEIKELKLLNFDPQTNQAELYIACSKGTYIRSIANDLGENLGVYGHLVKLVRVQAGDFEVKKSVRLDELQTKEDVEKLLLQPLEYLHFPRYELSESEKEKVSHGMSISVDMSDGICVFIYNNTLAAIAEITKKQARTAKVFL